MPEGQAELGGLASQEFKVKDNLSVEIFLASINFV